MNSTPEKMARKKKCRRRSAFRTPMRLLILRLGTGLTGPEECFPFPFSFAFAGALLGFPLEAEIRFPLVSGKAMARKAVSTTSRTKVKKAGTAYTLRSRPRLFIDLGKGEEAKYAPIGGPMQKHTANAIPTCASALDRVSGEVTSERMALGIRSVKALKRKWDSNTHGKLHVSFTESTNNAREHIRSKSRGLDPSAII